MPFYALLCKRSTGIYSRQQIDALLQELFLAMPDYSDQKIKELLQKEGISLSRRVINKYRNQLKEGNSYQRRLKS
jgi:DNA-directed RNA polymerase specialized sigma54-like protein